MSTIGDRIKEIRQLNKLSQEKFGERTKVTKSHISNIEKGGDNPSDRLIKLISIEFNINEEWLRFGSGPMGPNFTKAAIDELQKKPPENIPLRYKDYPELVVSLNSVYAQEYCKIVDILAPSGAFRGYIPFTYFPELINMINYLQKQYIDTETERDRFRIEFKFESAFPDYKEEKKKAAPYEPPVVNGTTYEYLPLIGRAAAGKPILIDEMVLGYIPVEAKNHQFTNCYLIEAIGDSMTGEGIDDGDLVIVRPQPAVDNGDITLIRIDDEATIKYFHKENDVIYLKSANPKYGSMKFSVNNNIAIIGKVIETLKKDALNKMIIPETEGRLKDYKKGLRVIVKNGKTMVD